MDDSTRDTPAPPVDDDGRSALELTSAENADLCAGCVKCCTYITVEIDAPRAAWEYDQWTWALHHANVNLYLEKPERWFLHFDTTCRQLQPNGRCAIHGRHPVLCRDYDPRSCERRLPLADIVAWFHNAEEFEAWIRDKRPTHWKRLAEYRRTPAATPEPAHAAGFVPVHALAMASSGRGVKGTRRAKTASPRR
jgi:Fe-S-cluster containining protein